MIYLSNGKDLYCILLLSVMPVDAAQKMMKLGWLGAEIWELYSRRYFWQDITLVELSLKEKGFEYKYIWRDTNTSFSKMRGRYDRARWPDNFNHKKVIIRGWAAVSDCTLAFAYRTNCDYKLYRIQSNFVKMKPWPQNITQPLTN